MNSMWWNAHVNPHISHYNQPANKGRATSGQDNKRWLLTKDMAVFQQNGTVLCEMKLDIIQAQKGRAPVKMWARCVTENTTFLYASTEKNGRLHQTVTSVTV